MSGYMPDSTEIRQAVAEHQEWLSELHKWQHDCRDAIDRLCRAQQCILRQSSTIGEQLTKICEHHAHLLTGGQTGHDITEHELVREKFETLKGKFPGALADLHAALDALEAGLPRECE